MDSRRQWLGVGAIILALCSGAGALVLFGSPPPALGVGSTAPDFSALDVRTAESVSFRASYRGQVTLINIWATYCVPCREEMPALQHLYESLGPKGLRIVAVSIDEGSAQDVRAFAEKLGLTFDILQDRSGVIQRDYQTIAVPESFLIDQEGNIVRKVIGAAPWDSQSNQRVVRALLANR